MEYLIALIVLVGLLAVGLAAVYGIGKNSGKNEAVGDELKADYEVKKARDRLDRDPAERDRVRDYFR